jgi:aminoglycoside 6'-N-acetyltransferase
MLRGERLVLRPALEDDAVALAAILAEPEVAMWWGTYDVARVLSELPGTFAILIDDEVIGWLHCTEETEPDYLNVAFDILLTTKLHARGYGREALTLAIRHFISKGHHRFTIDPAVENERAIRSYAAVGFKPVGVMRAYGRALDGTWRDALIMDLLADELVS